MSVAAAKPCLLLIDDEERILRSLSLMFRARYEVLATTDAVQALAWVRQRAVHVIVSDQRMPQISGVELLRQVREHSPRTMRILLTGYADLAAVEASVNDGEIFRFLEKPWDAAGLQGAVAQAAQIALEEFGDTVKPVVVLPPIDLGAFRVMVLDEDPVSAILVRSLLPQRCIVNIASCVETALSRLAECEHALVIAELRHSRDDVIEALKQLKQASPHTLAIACSNLRDGRLLIDLINHGQVFRFLPKPLGRELLRRALSAALEKHAELQQAPQRLRRHAVESPRQSTSLPLRLFEYLRRIGEQTRRRA